MFWYYYITLWLVCIALSGWLFCTRKEKRCKLLSEDTTNTPLTTESIDGDMLPALRVSYKTSKLYKPPCHHSRERMAHAVLKDTQKLEDFYAVFDTDRGMLQVRSSYLFANTSLMPGKDPEGNDCTVLGIKWRMIKAPKPLKIYSGFIVYRTHIVEDLDGLHNYYMKAGDSMNVAYTCNIIDDGKSVS
jgi:hypothetical protein